VPARPRVRLPALGALARARLWLSYQRYAALLIGIPLAAVALAARHAPWVITAVVALAGLAPARFGSIVLARWPRKLRATRVALARLQAGRFALASVRRYCGDPCFRIVAREVLARSGMSWAARRALVRRYADELRREGELVMLVDHVRGTVVTIGDDTRERT
jgi:hypothetical protein